MENSLIFQTSPRVTIASNTFVNVPIILRYENINLIEVIKEQDVGFTTQIPIYHQDGTYLAKATGNRLYLTDDGKKTGLKIEQYQGLWVCELDGQTLFEIHQQAGDAFKTTAELYTPDGYFIKCNASSPNLIDPFGKELKISGMTMSGNLISGCKIGIWIRNGAFLMGVNG